MRGICTWLLCWGWMLLLTGCLVTTSPTGRQQLIGGVSHADLNRLGNQAFTASKEQQTLSKDQRQIAYVQCVIDAIVAELPAEQRYMHWELALFVNDEPNAFALPGGKVGVHTGLLRVAQNQDQLAAVIGHEIGHVVANHHEERITQQVYSQQGLQALGAIAQASTANPNTVKWVNQIGAVGAQTLFLLPNSRVQEREADIVGQRLMARAGFDPEQAVQLWHNMRRAAEGRAQPPQWLSTHPAHDSRIAQLRHDVTALRPIYQQAQQSGRRPRCR